VFRQDHPWGGCLTRPSPAPAGLFLSSKPLSRIEKAEAPAFYRRTEEHPQSTEKAALRDDIRKNQNETRTIFGPAKNTKARHKPGLDLKAMMP